MKVTGWSHILVQFWLNMDKLDEPLGFLAVARVLCPLVCSVQSALSFVQGWMLQCGYPTGWDLCLVSALCWQGCLSPGEGPVSTQGEGVHTAAEGQLWDVGWQGRWSLLLAVPALTAEIPKIGDNFMLNSISHT